MSNAAVNLASGRGYLAIPGPSVIPDDVLRAMHRASPNIYEGPLLEITESLIPDLRQVARTQHDVAIYVANGHGAWEAALANTLKPGDHVLVPANGRFAHGWAEMAQALNVEVQLLDFGTETPYDLAMISEVLAADKTHKIKAVMGAHVDTSTSLRNDFKALRECLDSVDHPALLMADCIASMGCDRFEMDLWGVDVAVTGCQKGLMVPAGLSFAFFNDKAAHMRRSKEYVSRYWDWEPRVNPRALYEYFGGTPPTHHLFGLRQSLDMIHAEGIENVWQRHAVLARAIWTAVEAWGQAGTMTMNVSNPDLRSHAVTALALPAPMGTELRRWLEINLGLTLGIGLGLAKPGSPEGDGQFRIGHMGHVNGHMIMGLLGGIEAGLKALDIPHGDGALSAASAVMAGRSS